MKRRHIALTPMMELLLAITNPYEYIYRKGEELGEKMARNPCRCGHGKGFHLTSDEKLALEESDIAVGKCSKKLCRCSCYERETP